MSRQDSMLGGSSASLPHDERHASEEENGIRNQVVSRQEWLEARTKLLEHEKALTRHRDLVSAERLRLPWVRIEKDYIFDGPEGKLTLSDLFQGRSQLHIKHFMMAPGAQHQCVGCSLEVDHMTDILPHLEAGEIYHTYSAYGRGGEEVLGIYGILDGMPKGRNERGPYHSLTDWARPHNMYGKGGTVEVNGRYHAPTCGCSLHGQ